MMASLFVVFALAVAAAWAGRERAAKVLICPDHQPPRTS